MTYILATAIILTLLYRRKWRLHERDEDMRPCAFDRLTPKKNMLEALSYGTVLF